MKTAHEDWTTYHFTMDLLNIDDFTADTLQYLIDNEVEENVHLDYKAGTALQKNDRGKNEITKDISAFSLQDYI